MSAVQPTAMRPNGKSLKLSIGKNKIHAGDKNFARGLYQDFIINGAHYCRPHLMLRCHLCEVDALSIKKKVDEERERLGLRESGDQRINQTALEWKDFISEKQLQLQLESDLIRQKYGKDYYKTDPDKWENFRDKCEEDERMINDKFLAMVAKTFQDGAAQCCYWACEAPNAEKLLTCTGCGVVKYCSKEHQKMDWLWEHKGECTCQVPEYIKKDIERDRQKNLNGIYANAAFNIGR
jgi:hypothetical protein